MKEMKGSFVVAAIIACVFLFSVLHSSEGQVIPQCNETQMLSINCTSNVCSYDCWGQSYNFNMCFGCNTMAISANGSDSCIITVEGNVYCKQLCAGCNETRNFDIYCSTLDPNQCWVVDQNAINLWPETVCVNVTIYDTTTNLYTNATTTEFLTNATTTEVVTTPEDPISNATIVSTLAPSTLCTADNITEVTPETTLTDFSTTNPDLNNTNLPNNNLQFDITNNDTNATTFNINGTWPSTTALPVLETSFDPNNFQFTTIEDTRVDAATQDNAVRKLCWEPPSFPNTITTLYKDVVGMVATYTCRQGYVFPSGELARTIQCLGYGWSPTPTDICEKPIVCPIPILPNINNGMDPHTDVGVEQSVDCSDSDLRFPDGTKDEKIKCVQVKVNTYTRVGVYHRTPAGCAHRCESLPLLEYAEMHYQELARKVSVTCTAGHRMPDGRASGTFTCKDDDTWGVVGPCEDIYCPMLPVPANGLLSTSNVKYGVTVTARCKLGYIFPDQSLQKSVKCVDSVDELTDQVTAIWNATFEDCEKVKCLNPLVPDVATCFVDYKIDPVPVSFEYDTSITYSCAPGTKFSDGNTVRDVKCTAAATWSYPDVVCATGICDPVPKISNAGASSNSALQGTIVTYACQDGFEFAPGIVAQNITCDGVNWSPFKYSSCNVLNCPPLSVSYSTLSTTSRAYATHVVITCDKGYSFDASSNYTVTEVVCLLSSDWSQKVDCQPIDCHNPPYLANVLMSWVGTTFKNGLASYKCGASQWFSRQVYEVRATCSADGVWRSKGEAKTSKWGTCFDIFCPPAPSTNLDTSQLLAGNVANVTCPHGYNFTNVKDGYLITTCLKSGVWQPPIPECKLMAPAYVEVQKEAAGSQLMGSIAIAVIASMFAFMFLMDIPTFKMGFIQMAVNIVGEKSK